MPTYEYICDACQHEFEKFQLIKADPITVCPTCGKEQVRRKIGTGAGILFKGGGFYETDYRSNSYNEAKKKDTDGGTAKSDTKSDASPAKTEAAAPKAESPKPAESKAASSAPAKAD
ncbi:MAG: zinc ribbon domain-containing protein [Tepidisphaeraceae bacterium]